MKKDIEALSDHDIDLLKKAEIYLNKKEYHQALEAFDRLIMSDKPLPCYYHFRAYTYSRHLDYMKSVEDINKAIGMNPDNANYYWELGAYLISGELELHGKICTEESITVLESAVEKYRISLCKDPINQYAWINLIEVHLLLKRWDEAICHFGSSKPFISSNSLQVIRYFLGGLAIILSGEEFDFTNNPILQDYSIRVSDDEYRTNEIESLITEMEESGTESPLICKSRELHRIFMDHFDIQPPEPGAPEDNN